MFNMKLSQLVGLVLVLSLPLVAWGDDQKASNSADKKEKTEKVEKTAEKKSGKSTKKAKNQMLQIKLASGLVQIELYPGEAPKTVEQITRLAKSGFYNGKIFHRVEPGFVVQGGDPTGTGRGGSGKNIPAEFNKHKHVKGTVAMARTSDPNSADSQFYICLGDAPFLDGQYTVFGKVTSGMEFVDKIKVGDKMVEVSVIEAPKK